MKSNDINTIIELNKLTLSISTPVKLLCNVDQMLLNCLFKGAPNYNDSSKCKYCKEHQYQMNDKSVTCKKHYAIRLYNREDTKLSKIRIRENEYVMFGRYIKLEQENCTYVFYVTPIQIDPTRFRTYVYPKDIFDTKRKIEYEWDLFRRKPPMYFTFSIKEDPYILDYTNRYDIRFKKI